MKKNASLLRRRAGVPVELRRIADLDITTGRGIAVRPDLLTTDALRVTDDPEIDIVVELVGGLEPARGFVLRALRNNKHVVTANKALLSEHGAELFRCAGGQGVDIAFEASVGGGIPIIRTLQEGFASDRVVSFWGILNGTANYILSRMTNGGGDFKNILRDAQKLGYAEADPTLDVEGIDTLHKLTVLISLAFEKPVSMKSIYTEGISSITPLDIQFARELGYRIKLLAICRGSHKGVDARVHPTLVPQSHLLSQVNDTLNAVFFQNQDTGPTMLYGRGAGMMPTASAVVADIIALGRNMVHGTAGRVPLEPPSAKARDKLAVQPMRDISMRYYLRFSAVDKPGVLSKIAGILGRNAISIHSVVQQGRRTRGGAVPIFMLTHEARESHLQKALRQIDRLSILRDTTMLIRIEPHLTADG